MPVMMSSAAVPSKTFRASRKPFRDRAKTVRLPAGITVRLQPGIPFVFIPESFSRSPRNPVRLAPESPLEQPATGKLFYIRVSAPGMDIYELRVRIAKHAPQELTIHLSVAT